MPAMMGNMPVKTSAPDLRDRFFVLFCCIFLQVKCFPLFCLFSFLEVRCDDGILFGHVLFTSELGNRLPRTGYSDTTSVKNLKTCMECCFFAFEVLDS